ncbi:uncharacterized protein MONOS_7034 [Monocercomonoides exilis]|uniref:uncharacterized protein n=1 Tax=Monocercomonoides exilis TaxID=2049356 RepID=UPI003559A141|nr:hypothetical protein MONOS_7034 [Monocercomonoides exilis]|eukprot:MONOS_7034.1-p1 / transcript=MONOS_7034.1 / gene=MONOS_7034 / organism=Monocercomonoides_exilis_PA203 / gene_product=unspecified product / transcript_product=unspecified product / location=Mono_scaffold00232:10854-11756(-) / protein_length=301 / sequence_SO=supercontig / SO=protein_coding / is_pseudo=false
MKFFVGLLSLAALTAQFWGGMGGLGGLGMGGFGGMGGMGGFGGMGGMADFAGMGFGGMGGLGGLGGFGFLSGSELSEEELDELCCGSSCYPDGCCYELCACESPCGMGACGGFAPSFGGCQQGFNGCNGMGYNGMGCNGMNGMNGGFGNYGNACQAPRMYGQTSSVQGGRGAAYANGNNANCYGAGNRNCGYNQGAICGSANGAHMNADACRAHGDRAYARKCADEMMVRRANEACTTGNNCYDMGHANMCAGSRQIAGNRACGNANNCYNNAAGMNTNSRGCCGNGGCCRSSNYGYGGC